MNTHRIEQKEKQDSAGWKELPKDPGFYLVWSRGQLPDFIFYGGEEDPLFEPAPSAHYFGPIKLPLIP